MKVDSTERCSFCGKDRSDGRRMVHGPPGACVCEPCIHLLARIMDGQGGDAADGEGIVGFEQPADPGEGG